MRTLRSQIDELDPGLERIVVATAVLGRKMPFDLIRHILGRDEEDLVSVLRELVRRGQLPNWARTSSAFGTSWHAR
jgi:hypothetical protein